MSKMNTSFSKYVKQCKWGLGLDTAGSDYSAHQLARLLTTILGRLPGPSARRWEGSPAVRRTGGRPASPGRSRARATGSVIPPCRSTNLNSLPRAGTCVMLPSKDVGQERRREAV